MVRHSREDALDKKEFHHLLDTANELKYPFDFETSFILVAGGRLGMRAGEIAHMREEWIDWDRSLIEIPLQQDCDCGYCRQQALQSVQKTGVDIQTAMSRRWSPKTENSARAIPFDFDEDVEAVIRAFFDEFNEFPHSRTSINRRVDRVADAAGIDRYSIYPHALRATAATHHAYRGVPPVALQALMGWSKLSTSQKYIRLSGGATAKALRDVYQD